MTGRGGEREEPENESEGDKVEAVCANHTHKEDIQYNVISLGFTPRENRHNREDSESRGSESDKVLDGRLRIPGSIWSRLYAFQRTGERSLSLSLSLSLSPYTYMYVHIF